MNMTEALGLAFARMKRMLFQPFEFKKWLCLGVIIFLEVLLQGGGGNAGSPSQGAPPNISEVVNHVRDWVVTHLAFVLPLAILGIILWISLMILLTWLQSHGTMMLIRAVAVDDPRIGVNWSETKRPAFSLFLFRIALVIVGFVLFLAIVFGAIMQVMAVAATGAAGPGPYLLGLIPVLLLAVCMSFVFWLIGALLRNFVAPLMYVFDINCLDAWREFRGLCRGNVLMLVTFLLIRFVYFVPFFIATVLTGCCTCCIGFLPVVHHTLFAPFYVFDRAYSLYVLESASPKYQIIQSMERGPEIADVVPGV